MWAWPFSFLRDRDLAGLLGLPLTCTVGSVLSALVPMCPPGRDSCQGLTAPVSCWAEYRV